MPKQNAQSKPPHRPARRKSKPKFDVPAEVGEPSTATWVYRDDGPSEMPIESPAATAAATVAETITAPIAQAIEVAAAVAPERTRYAPAEEPGYSRSIHAEPSSAFGNPVRFATMGLLGIGVGMIEFFTTATLKVITAPFGIVRRLMPD